jgi:hypothetical protein
MRSSWKKPLGTNKCGGKSNIKVDLRETGYDEGGWIYVSIQGPMMFSYEDLSNGAIYGEVSKLTMKHMLSPMLNLYFCNSK